MTGSDHPSFSSPQDDPHYPQYLAISPPQLQQTITDEFHFENTNDPNLIVDWQEPYDPNFLIYPTAFCPSLLVGSQIPYCIPAERDTVSFATSTINAPAIPPSGTPLEFEQGVHMTTARKTTDSVPCVNRSHTARPINVARQSKRKRAMTDETIAKMNFGCPKFETESILGLKHTCNGLRVESMSAVRRHMTRPLRGGSPAHLPFLQLCPTCNEDFIDQAVFEEKH
ncbi:hypothetical protein EJ02DRAFT_512633 [Clathrospora elynae]|uniref:Uncharacterized protein n=1 Tax=Clathrospora elynae TaxID=706981 RepID=A0A6A5SLT4_9PLEO|nr:hypothetical protein EJ02DRAFT_512633 [Clathrospora elynae]